MTIRLEIHWDNASSPLLGTPVVYLMVDGNARPADHSSAGLVRFDLPDATRSIELRASFTASFAKKSHETLRIQQQLEVVNGLVRVVDDGRWQGKHPLVTLSSSAAGNGVTLVHLHTQFVDITPLWQAYGAHWDYYLAHRDPNARLRVLGCTSGAPLIWFASFAKNLEQHDYRMPGALVFYRPANYTYSRIDQDHDMSGLIRYLTKPKPGSPNEWERDQQSATDYFYIRCGFEDALVRAKRPVVMLHPWPSGANFGAAQGRELRELARAAVRLLWADQHIYRQQKMTDLGRLGVAGFSRGGGGLFGALAQGQDKIDEVYLFDCTGSGHSRGTIVQWFLARRANPGMTGDPCLRMVGGAYNINVYNAIRDAVLASPSLAFPNVAPKLTATPSDADMYTPGKNPVWEHVIANNPQGLRNYEDQRHQFAIHGGDGTTGPGPGFVTYLQSFLAGSRFGVI